MRSWEVCDSIEKILIKNGRVWDGERFFDADVLTDGEQIAQIRPNITEPAEFVYDDKGKNTCGTAIAVPFCYGGAKRSRSDTEFFGFAEQNAAFSRKKTLLEHAKRACWRVQVLF